MSLDPVSVVIELTEDDENPNVALQSIAEIAKSGDPCLIRDVHLVQWGFRADNPLWAPGLSALRAADVPFELHSVLDPRKLKSRALVRFEPNHCVTDGAFKRLLTQMSAAAGDWRVPVMGGCDHFALGSHVWVEPDEDKPQTLFRWGDAALAYGWLLVVMVLDTLRYYLNLGAYHRNCDLTARLVSQTYPDRTLLAPHRWWLYWAGTGIATTETGGAGCMLVPDDGKGMRFLLRIIRTHRGMGIGPWIIGFVLYYCVFSAPWWMLVLPRSYIPMWWMEHSMDPRKWEWYWQVLQAFHLLVVALISNNQMQVPWGLQTFHILLYPFYLATAPLVFVYCRLARSYAVYASIAMSHRPKRE